MVMYIIIGVVVVLFVLVLVTYNSLIQLRNKVKEAFSTMDVYLKKRYDLIPNLVDIVKGYAKHETDTLQEVTKMRVNAQKGDLNTAIDSEVKIGDALQSLLENLTGHCPAVGKMGFHDVDASLRRRETGASNRIIFSSNYLTIRRFQGGNASEIVFLAHKVKGGVDFHHLLVRHDGSKSGQRWFLLQEFPC